MAKFLFVLNRGPEDPTRAVPLLPVRQDRR